eukprot:513079-Pelagomonas_calceolata.AAC.1
MHKLFSERIAYIDGAMGTMIQRYKLERYKLEMSRGLESVGVARPAGQKHAAFLFGDCGSVPSC